MKGGTLRDLGEDALIARLLEQVPLAADGPAAGPGDDCAVLRDGARGDGRLGLLKTDALVEGVHYLAGEDGARVGWKAIARVLSDFAAMGGTGERFLLTLALPPDLAVAWIEDFYRGAGNCLRRHGAVLAGGETCRVPAGSAAVISVAATGSVAADELVTRAGARPGDLLFVTGRLGGSLAGRHLDFEPRLAEGRWLASRFKPRAMMDLSDGLAKDLPRLAAASGCGHEIDPARLPLSPGAEIRQALEDGEDFELLFACDPALAEEMAAAWRLSFPALELTEIGRLLPPGEGGGLSGGWDHFG